MSDISLKQLEAFMAVAESGSFTEAAERLYISQSTVSAHIGAFERALGTALFDRSSKKHVVLTEDGLRTREYARGILDQCDELQSRVRSAAARELVIGASSAPSRGILPARLAAFRALRPDCRVIVRSGSSEAIQGMVREGEIELGFVGSTDDRQSLDYQCIAEDHLVMVTADLPRYRALARSGAAGRALLGEPMIFRDYGSGTQRMVDNFLSARHIDQASLDVRLYVADPELIAELVAQGCGVSILSAMAVRSRVEAGQLLCFELDDVPVSRNIYLCRRRNTEPGELSAAFLSLFQEEGTA